MDCPGHSAFIKSVIAGAATIDLMVLVVDVTKGLQVQTAECIALGEILRLDLLVVLNKVDLLPPKSRWKRVAKTSAALRKMLKRSLFRNRERVAVLGYSAKEGAAAGLLCPIENLALKSRAQAKPAPSTVDPQSNPKAVLVESLVRHGLQSFRFSSASSKGEHLLRQR